MVVPHRYIGQVQGLLPPGALDVGPPNLEEGLNPGSGGLGAVGPSGHLFLEAVVEVAEGLHEAGFEALSDPTSPG